MNTAKFERYREQLLVERDVLVHEMDRIRESIPEEVRPPGEHEVATPGEGVEADVFLATTDETRLRGVDAALERIKAGTFGKCERCGRTIPAARLQALPSAPHCVACENSLAAT
jgi:DnaK suppressor protein